MTLSDNCCVNQDGVVRQGCLYTIMFHHLMMVFVNWCIRFGAALCQSGNIIMLIQAVLSCDIFCLSFVFQSRGSILF